MSDAARPPGDPRAREDWPRRVERNLRDQVATQERLLAALRRQQAAMGRLARRDLEAALDETASAARELEAVQAEWRSLIAAGREKGVRPPDVKGSDPFFPGGAWPLVLERLPAAERERLSALHARARDLAGRVARVNGVNRRVSQRGAAHMNELLHALAGGGAGTYAPGGGSGTARRAGPECSLLDCVA